MADNQRPNFRRKYQITYYDNKIMKKYKTAMEAFENYCEDEKTRTSVFSMFTLEKLRRMIEKYGIKNIGTFDNPDLEKEKSVIIEMISELYSPEIAILFDCYDFKNTSNQHYMDNREHTFDNKITIYTDTHTIIKDIKIIED